jgi:hypothetical protein
MDSVELMNRVDNKYLLPVSKLPFLLNTLSSDYRVLEISKQREFRYSTVYFDTPEYLFFYQHLTGKLGRYKVRMRTYEVTNRSYLEVKFKSNKGRTSKTRIKKDNAGTFSDENSQNFLRQKVNADTEALQPVINSYFTRITLVNLASSERVTIDYNVSYTNNDGKRIELPFLAIVEIKKDKAHGHSLFFKQLKKMNIREAGFSKFCLGVALLNNVPRTNNIKPKLLIINKIKNEFTKHDVA